MRCSQPVPLAAQGVISQKVRADTTPARHCRLQRCRHLFLFEALLSAPTGFQASKSENDRKTSDGENGAITQPDRRLCQITPPKFLLQTKSSRKVPLFIGEWSHRN